METAPASSPAADESPGSVPRTWGFGEPADPSEASRTIEIEALDSLRFKPAVVRVEPGDAVTFRVHNAGSLAHEFLIGTEADQTEAEVRAQRNLLRGSADRPEALFLDAGGIAELTWRFPPEGVPPVFFACHAPGHFSLGMKGRIRVEADR